MAFVEEIYMTRKVYNNDRKSVYRNYGQHQEWREVSDTFAITNGVNRGAYLLP